MSESKLIYEKSVAYILNFKYSFCRFAIFFKETKSIIYMHNRKTINKQVQHNEIMWKFVDIIGKTIFKQIDIRINAN